MSPNAWFSLGATFAAIGVGLGAFGAHGLKSRLTPDMLAIFETGVRYHLIHAIGLLAVGWAADRWGGNGFQFAGWAFAIGIAIFSGSLYVLSIAGIRWLGAVTPLGGLAFIAGWIALAVAAWRAG